MKGKSIGQCWGMVGCGRGRGGAGCGGIVLSSDISPKQTITNWLHDK